VILLIFGLIVGGTGIFRYQEVARLAREGARYASVRGTQYVADVPGATAATRDDIYNSAVKPKVVALDLNRLSCSVTWDKTNSPATVSASYEQPTGNSVSVTVTYQWIPEWFLLGPITLSSTSTMPMTY
jgi:Flp pilus assembly protein TadG